jgi:hypothetical protein
MRRTIAIIFLHSIVFTFFISSLLAGFCPHCGTKNDDNNKFCYNCGKRLSVTKDRAIIVLYVQDGSRERFDNDELRKKIEACPGPYEGVEFKDFLVTMDDVRYPQDFDAKIFMTCKKVDKTWKDYEMVKVHGRWRRKDPLGGGARIKGERYLSIDYYVVVKISTGKHEIKVEGKEYPFIFVAQSGRIYFFKIDRKAKRGICELNDTESIILGKDANLKRLPDWIKDSF